MTSLSNVLNLNEDGRWAGWGHLDARISAAYKIENLWLEIGSLLACRNFTQTVDVAQFQ